MSASIQRRVMRRLKNEDDHTQIIEQEIHDLLDRHSDVFDEAYEILLHCKELLDKQMV